ncbi:NfeD family protein [Candidatus Epulonipiscium viviparus]|uniref:NfeD family protein n=1 Tax=Candidatus Epulonipiscium viviparus TaxID=420336 RepID=UPI00016C08AF|nr:NfeD family protein [Candidatus Epulopiscium viviparus]
MWIILVIVTLFCYLKYRDNIFRVLLLCSILTLVSASFIESIHLQVALFLVYCLAGLIFLILLKQPIFNVKRKYNLQNAVGKIAIVSEPLDAEKEGAVKFNGDVWHAKTTSRFELKKGDPVRITKIEGLVFYVEGKILNR